MVGKWMKNGRKMEIRFQLRDFELDKLNTIQEWLKENKPSRLFKFLLNEKYQEINTIKLQGYP